MAKISQHLNKAIIYSLASLAETDTSDIIGAFKEDMSKKQLLQLGVDRINAVLLSLSGINEDPQWAHQTAVNLSHYLSRDPIQDPADSNYRAWGFAPISAAEGHEDYKGKPAYAVAVPGSTAIVVYAEVRERVLPAVSIATELTKRIAAFEEREDRLANNKDIAILKEQLVATMLKTAPIRPKQVPVMFHKGLAIFFTSSAKTAEDASGLFRSVLGTFPAQKISQEDRLEYFFKEMIVNTAPLGTDVTEVSVDDLEGLRFWPGTEAKLVDTNDGATYAIKGESLNSTTGTAYPMMSERPEVVVDAMTFTIYPMGMADVESRANAWEVKMNTKGYIQKFGPADKSTEPVNLIETRTQEYQENGHLSSGWERGVATIWLISVFLDDLLGQLVRERALIADTLGLGYTTDSEDVRRYAAKIKFLELRGAGYKARFNATLEANPELANKSNRDLDALDDEPAPESPDPDQKIYWKDDWENYGFCDNEEEFDCLVDLDEGHQRITKAEYHQLVIAASNDEGEDDGEI